MALTVTDRFSVVEGPIKRESIFISSSNTDAGTVESRFQNPKYVSIGATNGTALAADLTVSASGKTLTVTNPNADETYVIQVWGF